MRLGSPDVPKSINKFWTENLFYPNFMPMLGEYLKDFHPRFTYSRVKEFKKKLKFASANALRIMDSNTTIFNTPLKYKFTSCF